MLLPTAVRPVGCRGVGSCCIPEHQIDPGVYLDVGWLDDVSVVAFILTFLYWLLNTSRFVRQQHVRVWPLDGQVSKLIVRADDKRAVSAATFQSVFDSEGSAVC